MLRLFKIYKDLSTLSWLFEVLLDQQSWQIEKSQSRNMIKLTTKNVMCQQISWSRLRLLRLEGGVETKSRFLHLDWDFSFIKTSFLKLSRFSQLLRPTLCQYQEWESWLRHDQDKLRPQGLSFSIYQKFFVPFFSRLKDFSFWSVDQKFYFQ